VKKAEAVVKAAAQMQGIPRIKDPKMYKIKLFVLFNE